MLATSCTVNRAGAGVMVVCGGVDDRAGLTTDLDVGVVRFR